jgi:hypothetical protein
VALLVQHLGTYGTSPDSRLFVTRRGAGGRYLPTTGRSLSNNAYTRVWRKARQVAFSKPQQALAAGPGASNHLRHAAVSLWLSAGVPAP